MNIFRMIIIYCVGALFCLGVVSAYAISFDESFSQIKSEKPSGFYVGVNLGYGMTHWDKYLTQSIYEEKLGGAFCQAVIQANCASMSVGLKNKASVPVHRSKGVSWGLVAGYNFNRHISVQVGYYNFRETYIDSSDFNKLLGQISVVATPVTLIKIWPRPSSVVDKIEVSSWAVDLVIKLNLPITNRFSVYLKNGVAYLRQKSNLYPVDFKYSIQNSPGQGPVVDNKVGNFSLVDSGIFVPSIGGGVSYSLTSRIALDFSYTHMMGKKDGTGPDLNKNMPGVDIFMGGLTFKF